MRDAIFRYRWRARLPSSGIHYRIDDFIAVRYRSLFSRGRKRLSMALVCSAFCLLFADPTAARQGRPPLSRQLRVLPRTALDFVETSRVRPPDLIARDAKKDRPGPLQIAEPHAVAITPFTHGTWEVLPGGDRLWRLRVSCPGATDINLGFTRFRLPRGATLHLTSETTDYYQGPYTWRDNREHGQFWTPVVPGDLAVLEVYIPADAPFEPELWLTQINRGYRDMFKMAATPKQQSCNNDVICPEGDPWRDQIRSVARYTISGLFLCTGNLIMDVPQSFRPFFLTANHCGISAANDASVVVYWNFESPACGLLGGGSLAQNQSGVIFRASKTDVDFALVELEEAPDPAFDVFYSGWDRSGVVAAASVCIHHPNGDEKAISFNDNPITTVNSCIGFGVNTHWRVDDWEDGTTEPGSSGSGLWDAGSKRLLGFLSGGTASCFFQGPDCFGKFSVAWDAGTSASSRLHDWLDPQGTGAASVAGANPPSPALGTPVPADYDGDGEKDPAVFELETSTWFILQSQDGPRTQQFGFFGVIPVPADYDGDGVDDIAVFDPPTGTWFILASTDGFFTVQFGFFGVIPVPADYDGDGTSDLAVFYPPSGTWFIFRSTEGFMTQQFGYSGATPVVADYDGDGRQDIAVWALSTAIWFVIQSTDGFVTHQFGFPGVRPVPANYDGDQDNISDIAVWDPPFGMWYLMKSTKGFTTEQFGFAAVTPVPGDYDGDGVDDLAVYDPNDGTWYLFRSQEGFTSFIVNQ